MLTPPPSLDCGGDEPLHLQRLRGNNFPELAFNSCLCWQNNVSSWENSSIELFLRNKYPGVGLLGQRL